MFQNRSIEAFLQTVRGRLLVSCQAASGDPFDEPGCMARFALAAVNGGAAGIRANGPRDIRAIRQAVSVPIIGIDKRVASDGRVLITPDFDHARALAEAGADLIAVDCTRRGQQYGALARVARLRREMDRIVVADIATEEEAIAAVQAGAQIVLSTMRGYTDETAHLLEFDPTFISSLVQCAGVPVIAEGRIHHPAQARAAMDAGASAVIVGTAISRPAAITRWFANALREHFPSHRPRYVAAVDMGGTYTKAGIVSESGELAGEFVAPTPVGGRAALLAHLSRTVDQCLRCAGEEGHPVSAIGIATAGWVDTDSGSIAYATENLPGWTGAPVRDVLEAEFGLPTFVENDANVLAHAERRFGAAQGLNDFVCITLGTGVGGGCYANGALIRGANCFANAIGHMNIRPGGLPCTCGQSGCLEMYANATAFVRSADDPMLDTAEKVIAAANEGHRGAREAIRKCAEALADGCASVLHLLDPRMIVLSGGLAQSNVLLSRDVEDFLREKVMNWERRGVEIRISTLGYHSGVLGAAALALMNVRQSAMSAPAAGKRTVSGIQFV